MAEVYQVLLVEDNAEQADLVCEFLKLEGNYKIDWARDLHAMWEILANTFYDVILLDYRLPDGSGLDALTGIAAKKWQVPVIMVTGQGDERVAAQCIQHGAAEYVIKTADYILSLPPLIKKVVREFELHQAIEDSLEKNRYQALILDNMRDAVVVWDENGQITYWNPIAEALFGWRVDERLGSNVHEFYFPIFTPLPDISRVDLDNCRDVERQAITKKRSIVWISSRITPLRDETGSGKTLGYMDVCRNITERIRAEEEINRLYSAVQQSANSIVIASKSGKIEFANPAFEELTGIRGEDAIGSSLAVLWSNPQSQTIHKNFWAVVSEGNLFHTEFTFQGKKEEKRLLESITPIRDLSGDITHLLLIWQDVTNQRQMEAELQAAQTHLMQSARLAAIGELASSVAHHIYNPLTTVIANAQILLHNLPVNHAAREAAADIEKAGWKAQEVVKQLLDFARPASGNQELVSIQDTMRSALSLVAGQMQISGVTLDVNLSEDIPPIQGNVRQIEDLWLNLLLLSREATADGQQHVVQVRAKYEVHQIVVEICDDGKPISEERLTHIFEPDFIGPGIGRGTGLELSICREIVRQHNGQISVRSARGATVFKVVFADAVSGEKKKTRLREA